MMTLLWITRPWATQSRKLCNSACGLVYKRYHQVGSLARNVLSFRQREFQSFCLANIPSKVRVVEVGPRDGLQAEARQIDTADKIEFIRRLSDTGLKTIEATAFVNPKKVPQMADAPEVLAHLPKNEHISYPVLTPNLQGYLNARKAGAKEVAIFTAASETFQKKNANCSIKESIERFQPIFDAANFDGVRVRGYISCVMGCPYEGTISAEKVVTLSNMLLQKGCYEISLGDTIGIGTAGATARLLQTFVDANFSRDALAVHFHDTYGQALANIFTALQFGIHVIDSSVAGLGGCPFAKGATGNVATEEVVYMLEGLGVDHGIDMTKLLETATFIAGKLGKEKSRLGNAMAEKQRSSSPL
ncbi:putative hydroxymethylglutaryl-CoA lyase [Cardiosporidium cionae]|uniref:hydroxymethylglutaryl-CoA lyase n=1 Tax=Cardiosporidium cionae TaxID=476202 RepID=A0ABQ7J9P0_9APIC|nr:putative hydroxymethylglutaryl-CoA lyase [Cardiosporidium cionae]|eukprot:KAF8820715.1 putative hydroxymethylglutaryl-CoA lyase [Cardiosporidium cionae]